MRAFVDTSSLLKKYVSDPGRDDFLQTLEKVEQIVVSPVTYIELICSIGRNCEDNKFNKNVLRKIKSEIDLDYGYFHEILMDENLKSIAYELRLKYRIKFLDLIQLSSAKVSKAQVILTSDKYLYKIESKELKNIQLI